MNKLTISLCAFLICGASSFASAASLDEAGHAKGINKHQKISGFYLGGTIGTGKLNISRDEQFLTDNTNLDLKQKDTSSSAQSIQLLAGYQFNRIIAVEFAYDHYINNLKFAGFIENPSTGVYSPVEIHSSPRILSLQANIGYTFHSGWRPFVLTGVTSFTDNDIYKIYNIDSSAQITLRLGLGIEYEPAALNSVAFRASWIDDMGTGTYSDTSNPSQSNLLANYEDYINLHKFNIGAIYKF
ncbi:MAG: outer membrane beta-barrel protein [Psychromonas sp.]|nr:outer membrane beta-barrel protein [Psychromonas sp.]